MKSQIERILGDARSREILRFLVSGGINTGLTYLLFVCLVGVLSPSTAYTVTYAAGILLAYLLNTLFVFKSGHSGQMAAAVIASYLGQYLYGLAVLNILIRYFELPAPAAMAVVIITAVPLQYLLLRSVAARARTSKSLKGLGND